MKDDIATVAWKELSEVRAGFGRGQRSSAGIVLVTLFVSVVIPFSAGTAKFGGLAVMSIGLLVAAMWVLTSVPDSFAGERDHRTLETLLATRLPADAILAGKLLASVVVAATLGTVALVLSVIASDVGTVVHGERGDALSVPWVYVGLGVVLAVLVAFALSNVGILVALRASSAMVAMPRTRPRARRHQHRRQHRHPRPAPRCGQRPGRRRRRHRVPQSLDTGPRHGCHLRGAERGAVRGDSRPLHPTEVGPPPRVTGFGDESRAPPVAGVSRGRSRRTGSGGRRGTTARPRPPHRSSPQSG